MGSCIRTIAVTGRSKRTSNEHSYLKHFKMILFVILTVTVSCVSGLKTHNPYWNTTNSIFRVDNTDHIMDVNQGNLPWEYDQVNIICPFNSQEKHVIYSVSKEEFDSCRVSNPRPKIVAICDKPQNFKYFTVTFRSFSPIPGGLEFKPGQDVYFISTSNSNNAHRRVGGYCSSNNMKMIFKVADNREETNTINVNQPRKVEPTTTTTTTTEVYWSARIPQHREDYDIYYKPIQTSRTQSQRTYYRNMYNEYNKYKTEKEDVSALPLTY